MTDESYLSAIVFGGNTGDTEAKTEDWNGASWSEVADLSTSRRAAGGGGTVTAGIAFGGEAPPLSAATEEWSGSSTTIKVLTD